MWREMRPAVVGELVDPPAIGVVLRGATAGVEDGRPVVEVGRAEAEVVLEEVDVPEHVRHHELLIGEGVALEEVGVRGVVVDDHLVNLREAILVALRELLELHAETPVRIAAGEAPVGRDLVHLVVFENLEDGGKEVETVASGDVLDARLLLAQITGQRRVEGELAHAYFPLPKNSLMLPTMASLSRISLVTTRSSLEKCSRRSFTNWPDP